MTYCDDVSQEIQRKWRKLGLLDVQLNYTAPTTGHDRAISGSSVELDVESKH